jgi:hypothetical protein
MIADLDTLLTALHVELTDQIIPSRGFARSGPPKVTDAELVCLAVAQVLLRYDDERHWLRAAPKLISTCSRGCPASRRTMPGLVRMGGLRVLPQPFALVRGSQATADLHL